MNPGANTCSTSRWMSAVPSSSPCILALSRHAEDRIAAEQLVRLA